MSRIDTTLLLPVHFGRIYIDFGIEAIQHYSFQAINSRTVPSAANPGKLSVHTPKPLFARSSIRAALSFAGTERIVFIRPSCACFVIWLFAATARALFSNKDFSEIPLASFADNIGRNQVVALASAGRGETEVNARFVHGLPSSVLPEQSHTFVPGTWLITLPHLRHFFALGVGGSAGFRPKAVPSSDKELKTLPLLLNFFTIEISPFCVEHL